MPCALPPHTLHVFTRTPRAGDTLAIINEAGRLGDARMLSIERRFGLSVMTLISATRILADTAALPISRDELDSPEAG